MLRYLCPVVLMLLTLVHTGCSKSPEQPIAGQPGSGDSALSVYVVNYPLEYFAKRVGGEHVEVTFPAPSDEDPAFWTPDGETIASYQRADLILLNGATYAKWVDLASLPESKLCDTSANFANQYIAIGDAVTHSHGPEGEHVHGETAFTTWLDPKLAIEHARAVTDALSQRRPEHKSQFEANLAELEEDLVGFDLTIEQTLAAVADAPLLFSHPVYQYFQRRYGLNGKSVHWEPDETPTAEQWGELEALQKTHQARWMIWEGEPSQETVARLREMGIESVVFRPCGNRPDEGDYLSVMSENAAALTQTLGASATPATDD